MGCPSFTECFKKRICCCISNPRKVITYAWLISLGLVMIAFVVACISAAKMAKTGGAGVAAGFCAVWTAILLVFISIFGSVVMKKYKAPMAVGLFLGVIFIMLNQMLIIFGIFVERSQTDGQPLALTQSQHAMAVFAWFLFIIYGTFGSLLYIFRNDIIVDERAIEQSQSQA